MKHRCPVCRKVVRESGGDSGESVEFFPFCSERCKLVDLGAWLDGRYRITCGPQSPGSTERSGRYKPRHDDGSGA